MLDPGLEVPLGTLKASVLEEDKKRVESIVEGMIQAGEIVKIKKDRYVKKEN